MRRLLIQSLFVAAAAVVLPPVVFVVGTLLALSLSFPLIVMITLVLLAIWAAILIRAWYHYGVYGLWLLIGAPFVLAWPIWIVVFWTTCRTTSNCL